MTTHYDLIILGSGPAGEGAAMSAAKQGKRVAMVEQKVWVGGNCTHLGTIPSKALRHAVTQIHSFNNNPLFREIGEPRFLSFPSILRSAAAVIQKQVTFRTQYYSRNRVDLYCGTGRFLDATTIEITDQNGTVESIKGSRVLIATGSRPYRPDNIDFDHARIYDSDTILSLGHTPRRLIIYGAGVIGSEYASIFSSLGVLVDLVDTRSRLLSFLDKEVSDALSYHLCHNGVTVRHNEVYQQVEADDHGVTLHLKSGKAIRADALLWANGRTGNTAGLGLENVGIETNKRGQLTVNDCYQTDVDSIYAAGDVIGWPSLASTSYNQGRFAASHMLGTEAVRPSSSIPIGIYTIPEISSLGKTEEELTEEAVPYEVGKAFFARLARAHITGETVGMLKILFHRKTLAILGIHCFGGQAAEIVHIGQAIMEQPDGNNTLEYFLNTTFNYPTMAEAWRVAALDGFNRLV